MDDFFVNRAMSEFMEKLSSSTKISEYVDLPVIAVFGDTSSGKSSLLSNLAMIELPSNHSLTTRCPIKLQIRRSDQRQARISVQWKSNNSNSFPAFKVQQVTEETWNKIPEFVQEAQEHILKHTGKDVAPDIISLQISGPGISAEHPLTLIDLPGLVHARGQDDSPTLVADVQQLFSDYLQNSRCIILAVLPATVDFHNSEIMALAQEVDPTRQRTLPVITKPDLIDAGAEKDVLDLLLGRKLTLNASEDNKNVEITPSIKLNNTGFHMIKGRGQAALDRNESIVEGLKDEASFFETVEPWKSVADRSLFGTKNLREKLGQILIQQVEQTLPVVLQEIREKQKAARDELESMVGQGHLTATDRRQYYQSLCGAFTNQMNGSLSGKGGRIKLNGSKTKQASAAAQLHESCSEFMDKIRSGSLGTIKTIVEGAKVVVASAKGDVRGEVVHLDKTFACVDFVDEADDNIEVLFEYRGYRAEEPLEADDVWSDGSQVFVARENNVFDSLRKINLDLVRTDPSSPG